MKKQLGEKGFTMVEVVISTAIILAATVSLLGVYTLFLRTALDASDSVKAAYIAEGGLEAVRFMRDASWSANIKPLATSTPYGIIISGSSWQTTASETWVGGFKLTVSFTGVNRDSNGDIVSSGGTFDPKTRLFTSTVSWSVRGATTTKSLSAYLSDIYGN